jgi:hypothetical protein
MSDTATAEDDPRKGFASIAKKFFGQLPGQSLSDFAKELKALPDEDVRQIRQGIDNGSLTY